MERLPAVAGQFYPDDPSALQRELARCVPSVSAPRRAVAVISPHAGYVYSGQVAGETLAAVQVPDTVVVIGPNHHGRGAPVALMASGGWRLPLGVAPIEERLARLLLAHAPFIADDAEAHRFEHSLEVQVPFLQYRNPQVRIVPLVLGRLSLDACERLGEAVAEAIRAYGDDVLIVASSDMSHYEPRATATAKDRLALDRILALDPAGLLQTVAAHRITMCGVVPATVTLIAARRLGATAAELVRYSDSGEVSGDTLQVVGYAGVLIV